MSLINQMLQDLDARRASGNELALVPRYVRALPREDRSRAPWWFGAVGAVIGIGVAVGWHFMSQPQRAPDTPSAPAAAPAAVTSAVSSPVAAAAPQPVASQTAAATGIPASAVIARDPAFAAPVVGAAGAVAPPAMTVPPVVAPAAAPVPGSAPPLAVSAEPPRAAKAAEIAERAPQPQRPSNTSADRAKAADAPAHAAAALPQIDKRVPPPTASQLAEADYREGANLVHQGRGDLAQEKFRSALYHLPGHTGARQALAGLLIAARRNGDAEHVLQEGLRMHVAQPGVAMTLARLQVDRGDIAAAIETLRASAGSAAGSADYVAFLAALLQRQSRHSEAVEHYQAALSLAPGSAIWQMGLGISLQALNRQQDARAAYRRALGSQTLSPELAAYVEQQLRQLN